jgi:hypothetical protein
MTAQATGVVNPVTGTGARIFAGINGLFITTADNPADELVVAPIRADDGCRHCGRAVPAALIMIGRLPMPYRCCFLDANDTVEALEEIEADTLVAAIELANAMLKSRSHYEAVELWLGNRCAYRARRDQAAA